MKTLYYLMQHKIRIKVKIEITFEELINLLLLGNFRLLALWRTLVYITFTSKGKIL